MLIATIVLLVGFLLFVGFRKIQKRQIVSFLLVGLVVAVHWIFFFEAIKVSNVSVTLGCMASETLFASFLIPFFKKRKIDRLEVLFGLLIILGLYLIFQFEFKYRLGMLYALISAALAVVFTIYNDRFIQNNNGIGVSAFEMVGGFIGLTVYLLLFKNVLPNFQVSVMDWMYLLILGVICTGLAFVLAIVVMRKLSPYFVVLTVNLEPIYGILLAWLIFGESERMTGGFYLGAGIILVSVFLYPVLKRKLNRESTIP